jgi:NB-ARC domain
MSEELNYAVYMLLSANLSQTPAARNVFDMVFKSLEVCWSLLEATERLLMVKRRGQFLRTEHAQSIIASMGDLETELKFANLGATIVEREMLGHETAVLGFSRIRNEILLLRQAGEKASQPLVDKPELVSFSVPSAPRSISLAAIPDYEYVVAAALSGGAKSVSDPERATTVGVSAVSSFDRVARDRRGESPAVFSVDGGGGVGKTTLLLLVAHDARVRSKFDYILFLALGKDATEASVVSDISNRVEASGGGALAAKIRVVPAGEEQVQQVVNLTRPWLAKRSVLLFLDNV